MLGSYLQGSTRPDNINNKATQPPLSLKCFSHVDFTGWNQTYSNHTENVLYRTRYFLRYVCMQVAPKSHDYGMYSSKK